VVQLRQVEVKLSLEADKQWQLEAKLSLEADKQQQADKQRQAGAHRDRHQELCHLFTCPLQCSR